MERRRIEWLIIAAGYALLLAVNILAGNGAAFAGGGVAGVIFAAYTLRAI